MVKACFRVALVLMLTGCLQATLLRSVHAQASKSSELAKLYEQDQADRKGGLPSGQSLVERDQQRRERVAALLKAGQVKTAMDHFHAAMIFQHGSDSTDFRTAHDLAKRAVELDSTHSLARWLTAATWDRYLLSKGEPQWYGTQFVVLEGRWYVQEIDTARVSDAERLQFGTRTLAGIRAYLNEKNGTTDATLEAPKVEVVIQ